MARPVVLITGPDHGGLVAYLFTAWAVWRAGGWPMGMTASKYSSADLPKFDALIIGGGADISESGVGALSSGKAVTPIKKARKSALRKRNFVRWLVLELLIILSAVVRFFLRIAPTHGTDAERDTMEFEILEHAMQSSLPILGICRGAQLLNQFRGGTLHRDLGGYYTDVAPPYTFMARKKIEVRQGSILAGIIGAGSCSVNSLHRHAIDTLGERLEVCAVENNGIVQAIEDRTAAFIIGVQWHPEYLPFNAQQALLFKELLRVADSNNAMATEIQ